jgi:dTMP kinase
VTAVRWAGKVVVVEGLDGTGKSTLVQSLASAYGLVSMTTPGQELRERFRGPFDEHFGVCPKARALAYAATVFREGGRANELAAQGAGVVIDRYWASSLAYAGPLARPLLDALSPLVPPADCVLYVELDETTRQERLRARGMTPDDEASLERHAELRARFDADLHGPYARAVARVSVDALSPSMVLMKATLAIDSALARAHSSGRGRRVRLG